ncbi:hypothetical protein DNTS_018479, partial [Danionella cerebrum]
GNTLGLCGNFDGKVMNDLLTSSSSEVYSVLDFGNSWKTATPPCSDVITEIYPCERHSYCATWAQRRCKILTSDTFEDCHLKVDPQPYYQACVMESCSCEYEGKFLGFCTAVAAYAEACSANDVCVDWRTPDLCPVYCDYFNEEGEFTWHYNPCGQIKTCGTNHRFTGKLEGCYPKCPDETPYYDENLGKCTTLDNCTCNFNNKGTTTTHQSTTKFTTEGTTTTEETTTQPMTSKTSTEGTPDNTYITDEPSTPLTSQGTTTTHQSTTKFTPEGTTTTEETTTQPMTSKTSTEGTPDNTYITDEPSTPLTSQVIVTGPTQSTPPRISQEMNTTTPTPINTTSSSTTVSSTTLLTAEPTTTVCECKDVMRNKSWPCGQCEVYGDPHYISFQGATFDFMENCTYVLVEEQVAEHRFSIVLDNYYCIPEIDSSCARGIILSYWNDRVRLMVTEEYMVEASLNGQTIKPPYEDQTFRFESSSNDVSVFIKPIRSYVSLSPFNSLLISLGKEHFENNTQGQCGVCGGPSCIRRNGITEEEYCCDKTAYDWIVEDSLKPYCQFAPTNVPCVSPPPTNTPTTEPPPGPPCNTTICDLLYHEVFAECAERVDLTLVNKNCELDVCWFNGSVGACSALEFAASLCRRAGICVDWRSLSNGYCEITCPDGMVYDECHESSNTVCRDGAQVAVSAGTGMRSGCFCPDGQMLAEEHKQICVSECTTVWESNCHICTCNNQTKTEECSPKPPAPIPICSAFSMLGSDCCGNQICGNLSCAVRLNRMNLSISSCSQEVDLPVCEGHCEGHNRWIHTNGTLELKQTRDCCKESSYEMREITLSCGQSFTYKHVTGCQCKKENYVS